MSIFENEKFNTAGKIANILGAKLYGNPDTVICEYTSDSRNVKQGDLFLAIVGERFDGHDFINQAVEKGCTCVLCERIPQIKENCAYIVTDNTVYALGRLANAYLKELKPITIGVTGSVGKTTTKQFIYSVASQIMPTQKTEGNFNNELGLPYTVFAVENNTKASVLEMGMSFKGEMHRLSNIAQPDIACITNIGTAHIENLGSRENIAAEKLSIKDGMKGNGTLILNGDEPLLSGQNGIYIGIENKNCDYVISDINENNDSTVFSLISKQRCIYDIKVPIVGIHNVFDAAYGAVVGILLGGTNEQIKNGILNFKNTGMRQNIYKYKTYTFIEDCYNASPESIEASLGVLKKTANDIGGRAVAVLGDMRELGEFSEALHKRVGEYAAKLEIDALFTYGKEAEKTAEGFCNKYSEKGIEKDTVYVYNNIACADAAKEFAGIIKNALKPSDVLLFKASRAVKLEDVIEELKKTDI